MESSKVAMLTEQKLKEMEAEMNRFEEEILTREGKLAPGQKRIIIGSNTYNKMQAKIQGGQDHEPGVKNIPISVLSAPPPPPPSLISSKPRPSVPPLPPPPPPPTLSFVPPQIRQHRPPPPPGSRPPMQGPPRPPPGYMGGPRHFSGPHYPPGPPGMPPHMMHGGPHGPPPSGPMPPFMGHSQSAPPMSYGSNQGSNPSDGNSDPDKIETPSMIIAKPKLIYSAAPVKLQKGGNSKVKTAEKTDKDKSSKLPAGPDVGTDRGVIGSTGMVGPAVVPPDTDSIVGGSMMMDGTEPDDAGVGGKRSKKEKKKKFVRTAAGDTWEDPSLDEWDPDDFRIFCGDLGNEVTDEVLARAFSKFPTFVKAKVIRDKRTNKTKGYGFVSFRDPNDFVRAMREMNGKYVGNRPIKLRKSSWKDRNIDVVRKKEKEKKRLGLR